MESFCEAINCPSKNNFCLKDDTRCYQKDGNLSKLHRQAGPLPIPASMQGPLCDYLESDGRAYTEWYSEQDSYHRTEIQIVAALVKSKNGK